MKGPEERVPVAAADALVEGLAELLGQGLGGTLGVDGPYVALVQLALVAGLRDLVSANCSPSSFCGYEV